MTLEEIVYQARRDALADQEALVAGVRQRRARCLPPTRSSPRFSVARRSETGLDAWGWIAVSLLILGLVAAAALLAPWKLKFSVDARRLYAELYDEAAAEADSNTLGWLASAGYGYQALRRENHRRVQMISGISGALGILMVLQTLAWLTGLAID